jgi:metal-responsive CopG/Arc/MetJ family transcriptional regulator
MEDVYAVRPDADLKSRIRELESEYPSRSEMLRDALRRGVENLEGGR